MTETTDAELRRLADDCEGMPFRLHVLALLHRIDAVRVLLDDERRHLAMSRATYDRIRRALDGAA